MKDSGRGVVWGIMKSSALDFSGWEGGTRAVLSGGGKGAGPPASSVCDLFMGYF